MKNDKNIEHDLEVMQVVEKNLDRQKHDAVFCLIILMCLSNLWVILVAVWDYLGRPLKPELLTVGVELLSVIVLLLVLKNTKLTLKDFGLNTDNLKSTLKRAFIISALFVLALVIAKVIMYPHEKLFVWSNFDHTYLPTAIFQEFICRGGLLSILIRVSNSKHNKLIGLVASTLMFSSIHLFYGLLYMLAAGALSFVLGIIYLKDKNIIGVSLIHWIIGSAAFVLGFF